MEPRHGEQNPRARAATPRIVQPAPRRASFPAPAAAAAAAPALPRHSPTCWRTAADLYENSGATIPAIAAVMGCSRSTVYRVARSERWLRYAAPAHDLPRALKLALEAEKLGQQTGSHSPRCTEVAAEAALEWMNGPRAARPWPSPFEARYARSSG